MTSQLSHPLSRLVCPDGFSPLRDDSSIIGYSHTRSYTVRALDSDGFRGVSMCSFEWDKAVDIARRFLSDGSSRIAIEGKEYTGHGYARPEIKTHFRLEANCL